MDKVKRIGTPKEKNYSFGKKLGDVIVTGKQIGRAHV